MLNEQVRGLTGQDCRLDAAAAEWNTKCENYYDEQIDALQQDWSGWPTIWCNPPFGKEVIGQFVAKAIEAADKGTTVVLLLPLWTGYDWFQRAKERSQMRDVIGPVRFTNADGKAVVLNNGWRSTNIVIAVLGPKVVAGTNGPPIRKPKSSCRPKCFDRPSGTSLRTTLIHGDAVATLKTLPDRLADLVFFDPPYPHIKRPYGIMTEDEWHATMRAVLHECRRILKPQGSVLVVLQSNYEIVGRMRLWPWEFVCWAAEMWPDWGLVEDAYSFAPNALPNAGVAQGLLRKSVKWCVWLGPADCYRNQDTVLREPSEYTLKRRRLDEPRRQYPSGATILRRSFARSLQKRGGVSPLNMLVVPTGTSLDHHGHPAATPYRLTEWWCKYLLPYGGVLVDPFCGSGTTLLAGINSGASHVIGIEKENDYLKIAQRRILEQIDDSGSSSILCRRLDHKLIDYLSDWIDDAHDAGMSRSDVMGFWDQFSGLDRADFDHYFDLLPESFRAMWLLLAA